MIASPALLRAVAIAVPVNNEARLLSQSIPALKAAMAAAAQRYPLLTITACFALDRCSDASGDIIRASGFETVDSRVPGVGAARSASVSRALRSLSEFEDDRVFIACTDADSVVPAGWLTHLIELADRGSDVIIGSVRPAEGELDSERRAAWELTHLDGEATGHIHGANLGIRASVYWAAGGFAPVNEHEDVDLVNRARGVGARVLATADQCVSTSGRLRGRTDGGYAGYLRDQLIPLATARTVSEVL
jgi:hypothetical protein